MLHAILAVIAGWVLVGVLVVLIDTILMKAFPQHYAASKMPPDRLAALSLITGALYLVAGGGLDHQFVCHTATGNVRLVRYAQERTARDRPQAQFAALRLVINQEKSRLTTLVEGFAFQGFEFRKAPRRMLYMCDARRRAAISVSGCAKRCGRFRRTSKSAW